MPTINIVISVRVSTEGGGDEILFTEGRACVQTGGGD
jgi:hypothetical protein